MRFLKFPAVSANDCVHRQFKTGIVCVCNSTYCDTLDFELPKNNGEVLIVSSSEHGLRFKKWTAKFGNESFKIADQIFVEESRKTNNFFFNSKSIVTIDQSQKYQKIIGFGNAFTGAVSYHLNTIPTIRDHIYRSYYSNQTGLGLNILRIPIGGCDFDLEPWSYNESPQNDRELSNFTSLDRRDIERLKQLKNLVEVSGNSDIKIVGSAWRFYFVDVV